MINRCVLIVRAREPFLQWVKSLPNPANITLERMNRDTSAYLLPEYEDDHERDELVEQFFDVIFEEQLGGWWTKKATGLQSATLPCSRNGSMSSFIQRSSIWLTARLKKKIETNVSNATQALNVSV